MPYEPGPEYAALPLQVAPDSAMLYRPHAFASADGQLESAKLGSHATDNDTDE